MLISKKWLSEFVKLPSTLSNEDLASRITLSTVEVEKIIDQATILEHIILGKIKDVRPHPNADKLNLVKTDIGGKVLEIVCGAKNLFMNHRVAVALPGAKVRWHGVGDFVELKPAEIRGVKSQGMICAPEEIGFEKYAEPGVVKIWDITNFTGASAGTPLSEALGLDDVIFDIEHKSLTNRPDLMGHYGMAREVAALTKSKFASYKPKKISAGKGIDITVKIEDEDACPRYMAVAMDGIVVGESPEWVKRRLGSCGVRFINNIVDVTNFVMLELGQPMHAFDADMLGAKIVVRRAKPKEKITALDEETYPLDPEMLLITDGKKPVAIAGVMGGEGSGVTQKTSRIVFESANFDPVSVRKTSTKLALRSESSARFEKSLDPEMCELALRRAVELMTELSPGARVASKVVDEFPHRHTLMTISFSVSKVISLLGSEISVEEMIDILTRLGFEVRVKKDVLAVTIPSWRATKDVSIVEDVIEEIARVWGYDKIESMLPEFAIIPPAYDPVRSLAGCVRNTLSVGLGATETYRYAFVAPEILQTLGFNVEDHLKLANPLAEDRPYLCQSLVPNLFDTVGLNHRSFSVVNVFEMARVFFGATKGDEDGHGGTLPAQPYHLGLAYSAQGDESPIIELRRMVETTLTQAGFQVSFREMKEPALWMHPSRAAEILVDGKKYGILAEAAPEVSGKLGIDRRVAIAEMNLSMLATSLASDVAGHQLKFSPIPPFPDAKRDLAFTVAERTPAADLESAVRAASKLLVEYDLFDIYRGQPSPHSGLRPASKGVIEEGRKSMAVHLTFRSLEKTLESKEVDAEIDKIRRVLEKEFGATMRS